ncbi:MAG TPA: tyrosine/phenylalanine carboxypeptidase domain-containing protein [Polyangiaceae bacterium]|nr:tyrosine/phenylalanine carboxypeptidase domain-containing protein [Polyangiaceae bacterium]
MSESETSIVFAEPGDTLGAALIRLVLAVKAIPWRSAGPTGTSGEPELSDGEASCLGLFSILEYLEDRYRRRALLPEAPGERALVRYSLELSREALTLPRRGSSDEAELTAERAVLSEVLGRLEELLAHNAGDGAAFAMGSCATLTDLLVVVLGRALQRRGTSLETFPHARRVLASVGQMPSVEQAYARRASLMADDMRPELRDRYLDKVQNVLGPLASKVRLLATIGWSRRVEEEFFASGCERLPVVEYPVDRVRAEEAITALAALLPELDGDHVLIEWLRAQVQSFLDSYRMLLAVGTHEFYSISRSLYGGARTTAFDRNTTNLDLAEHVAQRLGDESRFVEKDALDTDSFVALLQERLRTRGQPLELEIVRDAELSAKVICGATRLRVREGATFGRSEAEGLWLHEVETHALTAQNGAAQSRWPLLASGGPRTTRTQEGLAVFSELYGRAMSSPRLGRIAERVRLVGLAEEGASFIDLHRYLVGRGQPAREAYLDAARICRGGRLEGGAPFTKDACYLAGLVDVYGLLRRALAFRSPLLGEILVSGRIHQNDLGALLWLREQGLLTPPRLAPGWLEQWDGMLSYFAFTSFLNEIDTDATTTFNTELGDLVRRSIDRYDDERNAGAR